MPVKKTKTCFVISAIGYKKTTTYANAKTVLDKIIRPALKPLGFTVKRADFSKNLGSMNLDLLTDIIKSDLVIVNLTPEEFYGTDNQTTLFSNVKNKTLNESVKCKDLKRIVKFNANVIYELGLRHSMNLPVIPIIETSFLNDIPFDIGDYRALDYDITKPQKTIRDIKIKYKNIQLGKLNIHFTKALKEVYGITFDELVFGTSDHMINWENSGTLEIRAKNVYAITTDLNWARYNLENLMKDVTKSPKINNKHCYILVQKKPSSSSQKKIIEKIIFDRKLHNHFEIRCIDAAKYNEKIEIGDFPENLLPLHSDFVIYEKTNHPIMTRGKEETYLVISSTTVPQRRSEIEMKMKKSYDMIFKSPEQVNKIENWFKHLWQEIGVAMNDKEIKTYIKLK